MVSELVRPGGMVRANPTIEVTKYVDTLLGGDLMYSSSSFVIETVLHVI